METHVALEPLLVVALVTIFGIAMGAVLIALGVGVVLDAVTV